MASTMDSSIAYRIKQSFYGEINFNFNFLVKHALDVKRKTPCVKAALLKCQLIKKSSPQRDKQTGGVETSVLRSAVFHTLVCAKWIVDQRPV